MHHPFQLKLTKRKRISVCYTYWLKILNTSAILHLYSLQFWLADFCLTSFVFKNLCAFLISFYDPGPTFYLKFVLSVVLSRHVNRFPAHWINTSLQKQQYNIIYLNDENKYAVHCQYRHVRRANERYMFVFSLYWIGKVCICMRKD